MAVAFAQPTDVVKVRFQAQAMNSGHTRRYCGTIDAYKTIAKEEGIRGLWKGRLTSNKCVSRLMTTLFMCIYKSVMQVQLRTLHATLSLTAQNW